MTQQRWFVVTALVAATSALLGLGALAAGGAFRAGTDFAGERDAARAASVLGVVSGVALVFMAVRRSNVLGGSAAAAGALVAALAFAVPVVQAFAAPVSTPADDTTGCGFISTPYTALPPGQDTPEVTETCRERLSKQKALVAVLALPTFGSAGLGLTMGLRDGRRRERLAT